MKKIQKNIVVAILSLIIFSCTNEEEQIDNQLVDNTENISKIINSFDRVLKFSIIKENKNKEELSKLFIEESRNQGVPIISYKYQKSQNSIINFSEEYLQFSNRINEIDADSKEKYQLKLSQTLEKVKESNLVLSEKQILVDNIMFLKAFSNWMETIDSLSLEQGVFLAKGVSKCEDGWWACWGKKVANVIGEGLSGAIKGCGIIGGVGATIGAGVGSLAGGIGALPGAAVGAVTGCSAGGVIGFIAGALGAL